MVQTTTLTTRVFAGAMLLISIAVLGGALASQYWGALDPCELCLLERWPWCAAIAISAALWFASNRLSLTAAAVLLALVFLVSAGLGFYHAGIELHWFAGPSACTASGTAATNIDELRAQLTGKQPVMCDQVQWSLFGVSLAGWNALVSLALGGFCAMTARGCHLRSAA
ncbi:MAG TPA: disulfide bond formation protein B [Stellaceae bacterium]|jgi:disulfide bond formation protein DsbB|nr:disulfide bond formation protein B [Stellaceae bacterium]